MKGRLHEKFKGFLKILLVYYQRLKTKQWDVGHQLPMQYESGMFINVIMTNNYCKVVLLKR